MGFRRLTDELLEEIRTQLRAGETNYHIAAAVGVCEATVQKYRKELGIGPALSGRSRIRTYLKGNNKPRSGDLVCDPDRILAPKPRLRPVIEDRPKPRMLPSSIPLPTKTQLMGGR